MEKSPLTMAFLFWVGEKYAKSFLVDYLPHSSYKEQPILHKGYGPPQALHPDGMGLKKQLCKRE